LEIFKVPALGFYQGTSPACCWAISSRLCAAIPSYEKPLCLSWLRNLTKCKRDWKDIIIWTKGAGLTFCLADSKCLFHLSHALLLRYNKINREFESKQLNYPTWDIHLSLSRRGCLGGNASLWESLEGVDFWTTIDPWHSRMCTI